MIWFPVIFKRKTNFLMSEILVITVVQIETLQE